MLQTTSVVMRNYTLYIW